MEQYWKYGSWSYSFHFSSVTSKSSRLFAAILWLQKFLFCLFPALTNEFWTCSWIIYLWEKMNWWCRFGKQWIRTPCGNLGFIMCLLFSLLLLFMDKLVDWECLPLYDRHRKCLCQPFNFLFLVHRHFFQQLSHLIAKRVLLPFMFFVVKTTLFLFYQL